MGEDESTDIICCINCGSIKLKSLFAPGLPPLAVVSTTNKHQCLDCGHISLGLMFDSIEEYEKFREAKEKNRGQSPGDSVGSRGDESGFSGIGMDSFKTEFRCPYCEKSFPQRIRSGHEEISCPHCEQQILYLFGVVEESEVENWMVTQKNEVLLNTAKGDKEVSFESLIPLDALEGESLLFVYQESFMPKLSQVRDEDYFEEAPTYAINFDLGDTTEF
ncbi:MAG: hypothetical protein ABH950_03025 [Candidatus Altiarchaeota archaeon]